MFRILQNVGMQFLSSATKVSQTSLPAKAIVPSDAFKTFLTPTPSWNNQVRTVTKFSLGKGQRKSVKVVLKKFFRLHWGAWIRTKAGRNKRMWNRTPQNRRELREHVLCNGQQTTLLDRMVSNFWRRPKYYINDPYTPYHTREEFYVTRRKPWRPEGWE